MQGTCHTYGDQARMEPNKIHPVVSSDIDILVSSVNSDKIRGHKKETLTKQM